MKIISQVSVFDDTLNENLGDLERLRNVLNNLPDEEICRKLNEIRGNGRNEWPVAAIWNSLIASFIFDHDSVASLIRELNRNSQLRIICGFQPHLYTNPKTGTTKMILAPSASAYTNFLNNLRECKDELRGMFEELVRYMYENLNDFGDVLMIDGKAIQSFATKNSENPLAGNRGENDADWCRKTYTTNTKNGEKNTKVVKWFGFRLHLISDAAYELPVDFEVTKASDSEVKEAEKMISRMKEEHPEIIKKCNNLLGDRGYDSTKLINMLNDSGCVPIIDIRNMWKDGEETRQYRDTDLVYTFDGKVYYVDGEGEKIKLTYKGYDKSRDSLRYGFHPKYNDDRIFRISISEDPRVFTRVARDSKKWGRLYGKRSGIERMNGRIDRDYKFEKHTIRGLEKMKMMLTITLCVNLAMAKSKINVGVCEGLASLYV